MSSTDPHDPLHRDMNAELLRIASELGEVPPLSPLARVKAQLDRLTTCPHCGGEL